MEDFFPWENSISVTAFLWFFSPSLDNGGCTIAECVRRAAGFLVLLFADQKDQGFEVDCDSPEDETCRSSVESDATPFQAPLGNLDEPDAVASLPTPGDILVSYSTFPGEITRANHSPVTEQLVPRVLDSYLSCPPSSAARFWRSGGGSCCRTATS